MADRLDLRRHSAAFFGLAYAVYAQIEHTRQTRLLRGGETMADWTIAPDLWRRFIDLNRHLNAHDADWACRFDRRAESQAGPVRIVIGKDALMIGDDFHSLPRFGFTGMLSARRIDGQPGYLEFHLKTGGGESTTDFTRTLRVPVPPGAEEAGDAGIAHYQLRVPPPPPPAPAGRFFLLRNMALTVAIVSAAVFAAAMLFGRETKGSMQIMVLVGAIGGALLCPGALIVAIVWHLRGRSAGV